MRQGHGIGIGDATLMPETSITPMPTIPTALVYSEQTGSPCHAHRLLLSSQWRLCASFPVFALTRAQTVSYRILSVERPTHPVSWLPLQALLPPQFPRPLSRPPEEPHSTFCSRPSTARIHPYWWEWVAMKCNYRRWWLSPLHVGFRSRYTSSRTPWSALLHAQ